MVAKCVAPAGLDYQNEGRTGRWEIRKLDEDSFEFDLPGRRVKGPGPRRAGTNSAAKLALAEKLRRDGRTPGLRMTLAAAVAVLALAACNGGGSSNTPSPEPTASAGQRLTAQVFATVTGSSFDAVVGVQRIRYRVAGVEAPRETECYAAQSLQAI